MSILTDEIKKELKEKINGLDINAIRFQEEVEVIIDQIIEENKEKFGSYIVQKTVDEALEEEKAGFQELQQLKQEGVWDNIKDVDLKNRLKQKAKDGIADEISEKISLEKAGFLKEPQKQLSVEDIIEEILNQLEEVMDEKKKKIDDEIAKKEDMIKKVNEREKLRVSRAKVSNLHQKTKTFKGEEGKNLNKDIESAIVDLDKQIEDLVLETTLEDGELQSEDLKREKEMLIEKKNKLVDAVNMMKEKYSEDKIKKDGDIKNYRNLNYNKAKRETLVKPSVIKNRISMIINRINFGIETDKLIEQSQKIREIYENCIKAGYTKEEMKEILNSVTVLSVEKNSQEEEITTLDLVEIGKVNEIRKKYIEETSKSDITEEDKEVIEKCKIKFEKLSEKIFQISNGAEPLPLQTVEEYIKELRELKVKASNVEKKFVRPFKKSAILESICYETQRYRDILEIIINSDETNPIYIKFNEIIETLEKNKMVDRSKIPEKLERSKKNRTTTEFRANVTPSLKRKDTMNVYKKAELEERL